jgi:MFS family permease
MLFYVAYFTYYAPYRALYSDVVPRAHAGRAQGLQGAFRAAGMGAALIGGALLMPVGRALPFVAAAAVLLATAFAMALALPRSAAGAPATEPKVAPYRLVWSLLRDRPELRRFLGANVLWQLMEGGLKTFIVLYIHHGLHRSFSFSAGAMAVVALSALVSAPLAGKLADRFGGTRVMRVLLWVFGLGVILPAFSTSMGLLLVELPLMGMGGAMALALPYALLMRLVPRQSHGATAGLFDVTSGAGTLLGPLVTGAAIDLLRPLFPATSGYAAMWLVIGGASLASTLLLREPKHQPARLSRSW